MLFRLGKHRTYLLNSPEEIREVMHEGQTKFDRPDLLADLKPLVGEGLFSSKPATWVERRRLLSLAFRSDGDDALVQASTRATEQLLERLDLGDSQPGRLDLELEIKRACLGTLLDVHFVSGLSADHDRIIEALDSILQFASMKGYLLRLARRPWATLNSHRSEMPPAVAGDLKYVDTFLYQTIRDAKNTVASDGHERGTGRAMSALLTALEAGHIDEGGIRDELATLLFAGFDTVAEMVTWALHLVATHPDVEKDLRSELATGRPILAGMRVQPDGHEVDVLQRILFEALRLYPPAWAFFRSPPGPAQISGNPVEPRSVIMACPFALQRNPDYWPEPDAFRPDRHSEKAEAGSYIPFGFGQHMCIGRRMALIEGRVMLSLLLRRYRFSVEHGPNPKIRPGIIIQAAEPLRFRLERI
jgi:cytochrome P450